MDPETASHHRNRDQSPPRRRRRPPLSCIPCRRRKLKCDRSWPCAQCTRSKTVEACTYAGSTQRGMTPSSRSMTPRPTRTSEPVAGGGLHVFDSKRKPSSNDAADSGQSRNSGQSRELNELRGRVQYLESALSLPGAAAIPTPETHAGDGGGGGSRLLAPEDELVRDDIDAAPEKYFRGRNGRTRHVGRCHWTLSISFVRRLTEFPVHSVLRLTWATSSAILG